MNATDYYTALELEDAGQDSLGNEGEVDCELEWVLDSIQETSFKMVHQDGAGPTRAMSIRTLIQQGFLDDRRARLEASPALRKALQTGVVTQAQIRELVFLGLWDRRAGRTEAGDHVADQLLRAR